MTLMVVRLSSFRILNLTRRLKMQTSFGVLIQFHTTNQVLGMTCKHRRRRRLFNNYHTAAPKFLKIRETKDQSRENRTR